MVRYLVDTNILLWYLQNDIRLPKGHYRAIIDPESDVYVSIASLWEITIKCSKGILQLDISLDSLFNTYVEGAGFRILPVEKAHLLVLNGIPFHHRDPFDRLIYAQSLAENMTFLYTDKIFDQYQGI